jgi:hypothetical protein
VEVEFPLEGQVIERQELLDGTVTLTFDGASPDGRWTAVGSLSWSIGPGENTNEGDITLTRDDGAELFGTLAAGDVSEAPGADVDAADYAVRVRYEVDSGSGAFDGATGTAEAEGAVSLDSIQLQVKVSVPDA